MPLWKVDSDTCTCRDDSHAEENYRFEQQRPLGWTRFSDSRRWTFWHDGLAWLGGWKRDLRPLRKLRKRQSKAAPLLSGCLCTGQPCNGLSNPLVEPNDDGELSLAGHRLIRPVGEQRIQIGQCVIDLTRRQLEILRQS